MRWLLCPALAIWLLGSADLAASEPPESSTATFVELSAKDLARRAYERRRADAHSRMPNTLYAATPSEPMSPHASREAMQRYDREIRDQWYRTAALIPHRYQPLFQADDETAEEVFQDHVSLVVQAKCVNCHVASGVSGATRIVFVRSSNTDHEAVNRQVFENFLAAVDGGAQVILNKIRGIGHGGGIQVPAGSQGYGHFERFLTLLGGLSGGDDDTPSLTPSALFRWVGVGVRPKDVAPRGADFCRSSAVRDRIRGTRRRRSAYCRPQT